MNWALRRRSRLNCAAVHGGEGSALSEPRPVDTMHARVRRSSTPVTWIGVSLPAGRAPPVFRYRTSAVASDAMMYRCGTSITPSGGEECVCCPRCPPECAPVIGTLFGPGEACPTASTEQRFRWNQRRCLTSLRAGRCLRSAGCNSRLGPMPPPDGPRHLERICRPDLTWDLTRGISDVHPPCPSARSHAARCTGNDRATAAARGAFGSGRPPHTRAGATACAATERSPGLSHPLGDRSPRTAGPPAGSATATAPGSCRPPRGGVRYRQSPS